MRRLVLPALVVLPLSLGTAVPGGASPALPAGPRVAATTAAATGDSCTDAVLLAVPGGGEGRAGSDEPGSTLATLTGPLLTRAHLAERTVTTQVVSARTLGPGRLQGRGTRRTPAEKAVTRAAWRDWRAPVGDLSSALDTAYGEAVAACPDQLVYLAGYSQGAEAVHRFLSRHHDDTDLEARTVAAVLVGDSARVAGSRGRITGDPAAPRRAAGVSNHFDRTPLPAVPADGWRAPVQSVCTADDVACDLGPSGIRHSVRVHRSYDHDRGATLLAGVGRWAGDRIGLFPKPATGQQATGRVGLLLSQRLRVSVAPEARDDLEFAAVSELPGGLALSRGGRLSGTPTEAGTFTVDYTVRNTASRALSRPMPGSIELEIAPAAKSQVSAGGRHTCEIRAGGTLWCWGANFYGQLGAGDTVGGATPRQVGSHDDWSDVSAGGMHTCGVRDNGTLWCWGLNYRGQLGIGGRDDKTVPRRVGDGRDWQSVSAGWVHTCATKRDGSAWCWGDNTYGQLGSGSRQTSAVPVKVTRRLAWRDVVAGAWHTCGVSRPGAAYCWGRNIKGQLGDGTRTLRINPARVGDADDWLSVQPAWTHTCGLRQSGAVNCWGSNEGGQLGGGKFGGVDAPRALGTDHTWSAVQTGVNFSCALDDEQALWCWGTGRFGQLGEGTTRSEQPIRVLPDQTWAQMDLGWLFGCGLPGSGGSTICWGNNETGELGSGGTTARSSTARTDTGLRFNLVTFNVLGSNHTAPRRDAGEFSPARVRSEWMIDYLRSIRASVVGFQEMQRDQVGWFTRGAGDRYAAWPGTKNRRAMQTTIAWRRDQWRLLRGDTVAIPFITQTREMPLVHLEHRATGRQIWVMNVHNAPQDYQQQRNTAVRREIRRLKDVVGRGDPVFLIGDFNERQRVFCEVSRELDFVAPRGGDYSGGECHPPDGKVRVDWIFGSRDADYSRYREDRSPLVKLITDHAVLRTRVSVP